MASKIWMLVAVLFAAALGNALGQVNIGAKTSRSVFLQLEGSAAGGQQYFLTRLPKYGEAVDMVFVGRDPDNNGLNFQLRVR